MLGFESAKAEASSYNERLALRFEYQMNMKGICMKELTVHVEVETHFGDLIATYFERNEELTLEPNLIRAFLDDCREVLWEKLAQGFGQNLYIDEDDWRRWLEKSKQPEDEAGAALLL